MEIALDLARSREGLTGTNPSVGCVIVKNDNIISVGQTSYDGRPHAEFNAIKNCNTKLYGAKMYVTLEPCSHQGVTPPCTNEIIKSKISEVFYALEDTDKRVRKKSFKILKSHKINVSIGLLKNKVKKLPLRNGKQDERARSPRLDARGRANAKDEHHRREGRRVVVQVQGMRGHLRPRLVGDDAEEAEAHGGEGRVHSDLPHRVPARAHPGAECQGRCDQQGVVQHERNHSCVGILRKKIHTPRHVSNISTIFTDSTS